MTREQPPPHQDCRPWLSVPATRGDRHGHIRSDHRDHTHKRSHTAVELDDGEEIISQLRVDAGRRQVDQLLAWAPAHPDRVWAVENAHGMGDLLPQQQIGRGETGVDVPATLAARARKLSGKSARNSDPHDARSVASAAAHNRGLQHVRPEDLTDVIGLLLDRRWQLVSQRQLAVAQPAHPAR